MNNLKTTICLFLIVLFYSSTLAHDSEGRLIRDTLTVVNGTILVNTINDEQVYFLDTNNDQQPDIFLEFGPSWYSPADSLLAKPVANDNVQIEGYQYIGLFHNLPGMVVCYINDKTWRIPYSSCWNYLGRHIHTPNHHVNTCIPTAFSWTFDEPQTVDISGTVMVDTTLADCHFLDTDQDGMPDYRLNFGPDWYKPQSGISHPADGAVASFNGGYILSGSEKQLIVYSINGVPWREPFFRKDYGGGWLHRNITSNVSFSSPFDSLDRMEFVPDWHPTGVAGRDMPDSFYCRILEMNPKGIPKTYLLSRPFAAYEIAIFDSSGENHNYPHGHCGGHEHIVKDIKYQFHYTDEQLQALNIDESTIRVRFWYDHIYKWDIFPNTIIDYDNNIVTVYKNTILNFIALTGNQKTTDVHDEDIALPKDFILEQNYPNPFNPTTTISYYLPADGDVSLKIFDMLGNEITTLVNSRQNAGKFQVDFDASTIKGGLSSGIYFYTLKLSNSEKGNFVSTKKLVIVK